jgi:hypothetical protein
MVLEINKISHAIKLIWIYFLQYSFATEAAYSSPLYNTSSDTTGAYEAGGGGGGIAFAQPPPPTPEKYRENLDVSVEGPSSERLKFFLYFLYTRHVLGRVTIFRLL